MHFQWREVVMARADTCEAPGIEKFTLTPMADMTFLILVFILCTGEFKTFGGKLDTYLPRDG